MQQEGVHEGGQAGGRWSLRSTHTNPHAHLAAAAQAGRRRPYLTKAGVVLGVTVSGGRADFRCSTVQYINDYS